MCIRDSLYLEYYLGREEKPVLDENGNQVYYDSGKMQGKPKFAVKPVSYTHLDVYKRQPLYRIENERFVIQIGYDVLSISSKMP